MSPQPDEPSAGREIRLEVEVPGTPEQVWAAIATGPGISAWFVPTELAEQEGGLVTQEFGPGMTVEGRVTAWEPPRRLVYEAREGVHTMAFEWIVEARAGGTAVVRLVNSGFGTGPDADAQADAMEAGWRLFLDNLRLYLTHFRGRPSASIIVNGTGRGTKDEALGALLAALRVAGRPAVGARVTVAAPDAPPLAGAVQRVSEGMVTLLLDEPAPGVAFLAAEGSGETRYLSLYAYLFGDQAAALADRDRPAWRSWMRTRFADG
jgi:uncharacterized protein YndB with AHSA1/START domain